ncbi:YkgJ family cysteine cluster protein [Candidatus Micrarchaeota archaeon]|nr:YkgJ family cysteine cluster protein [Candidatus Micrarchaeota archaeon]
MVQMESSLNGPCAECTAKCCKNYVVAITAYDLVRLVDKVDSLDWVDVVKATSVEIPLAHRFFLFNEGFPEEYLLCLKRDNAESCIFLGKNNYCGVYNFRPMTCRVYPFQKGSDGELAYKEKYRCPVSWTLDKHARTQFFEDVEKQKKELENYGKWCREWNAKLAPSGNLKMFLEFMISKVKESG